MWNKLTEMICKLRAKELRAEKAFSITQVQGNLKDQYNYSKNTEQLLAEDKLMYIHHMLCKSILLFSLFTR